MKNPCPLVPSWNGNKAAGHSRLLPDALQNLFAASVIGFALAWLGILLTASFPLYLPNRHVRNSFFLILLVFVALNLGAALRRLARWSEWQPERTAWLWLPSALGLTYLILSPELLEPYLGAAARRGARWALVLLDMALVLVGAHRWNRAEAVSGTEGNGSGRARLGPALVLAFLVPGLLLGNFIAGQRPGYYRPDAREERLFAFVRTLPKDALLAGDPCTLNSIPFYGRRAVLFSCERLGVFPLLPDRLVTDGLRAYFAEQGADVYNFCKQYGVDYLVVNSGSLQPSSVAQGNYFYEPYTSLLRAEVGDRSHFALASIPEEVRLYQDGALFIAACDRETLPGAGDPAGER